MNRQTVLHTLYNTEALVVYGSECVIVLCDVDGCDIFVFVVCCAKSIHWCFTTLGIYSVKKQLT